MGRKYEVRKEAMHKTHLKRSKLFARYGKAIYIRAKEGGPDPDTNVELAHLIERAKKDDVPNDVIERNLKKATEKGGEDYEYVRYEGYGPAGSAVMIDALTDNVNRTVSDVRYCFMKAGSKLGVKGSVEHLFDHLAIIRVAAADEERILEWLLEADLDVSDIIAENGSLTIEAAGTELDKAEAVLRENKVDIEESTSGWFAKTPIELAEADYEAFKEFLERLNDLDDIQAVYHNVANDG